MSLTLLLLFFPSHRYPVAPNNPSCSTRTTGRSLADRTFECMPSPTPHPSCSSLFFPSSSNTLKKLDEHIAAFDWNKDTPLTPIIPVIHGTGLEIAWSIASNGFSNLSLLDAGYYGRGTPPYSSPFSSWELLPRLDFPSLSASLSFPQACTSPPVAATPFPTTPPDPPLPL